MTNPITIVNGIQCRVCRECGKTKPLSEYPVVKSKRNGKRREVLRAICKRCYQDHRNEVRRQKTIQREHVVPETKVCPRCGMKKASTEFNLQRRSPDGLGTYCKQCLSDYYEANKEKEIARVVQWQRDNKERHMEKQRRWESHNPDKARAVKAAAAHKNRDFVIDDGGGFTANEWLELCVKHGNRCVACGAEGPLTVDHVIPVSKGGSSDISNIQPLCGACNRAKGQAVIDYRMEKEDHAD